MTSRRTVMPRAAGILRRFITVVGWAVASRAVGAQPSTNFVSIPLVVAADDSVPPTFTREFRGVWVATVDNIDWPSRPGLSTADQQRELIDILNRAVRLHLNAIILQVRPSADALYKSSIEPWSYFLTGVQGKAPSPAYDPLAFAVDEAHQRGLELHAWFNPYRARHPAEKGHASRTHVSRARPSVVKRYGKYLWMDPGDPWVRARTTRVILDVVKRYDIDGVHIDDYFYPYPERTRRGREIDFPDATSWKRYRARGGTLERHAWRRDNVDRLVDTLYSEIKRAKPWVKFGVSPFGIWRPGFPESVRGFDAYDKLYADARRWLNQGWADYFSPQLYWKQSAPQQSYGDLLAWWRGENRMGRHIWPGNYTSRVDGDGGVRWSASEIIDQVRLTRESATGTGNIHFSMSSFVKDPDSLVERLIDGPYAAPAIVPASPWLSAVSPLPPVVDLSMNGPAATLTIAAGPVPEIANLEPNRKTLNVRWWTIRALVDGAWQLALVDARQREVMLPASTNGYRAERILVTAIDRAGNESVATSPSTQ